RQDFDLILQHRHVHLERNVADQLYKTLQENALYLDLVARELLEQDKPAPQELIKNLTDNPDNIFSLSIARLKRRSAEWREVIKPVLGVLLAAGEPLSRWQIRRILQIDDERLRDALARLGGLVSDIDQRYTLFHLKL